MNGQDSMLTIQQPTKLLKTKIEENKTAIMLGLTYLNRYYDLKFGDYNLKEVLFKPDFYGEKVPLLDRLIKIGRSTENQLKGQTMSICLHVS